MTRLEGKAKILTPDGDTLLVTFKDEATAFNGGKHAVMPGKGSLNARLSGRLFQVLATDNLPTCHAGPGSQDNQLRYRPLAMIPLEVVVHNDAYGSLCKRYGIPAGQTLSRPTVEFFLKQDALNDPLIGDDLIETLGYLPDGVTVGQMKRLALAVNESLVRFFADYGIRCADFKLEFGLDTQGVLTIGDELSPDNFRLRDARTGQVLDKDVFRQDLADLVTTYQHLWDRLQGPPPPTSSDTLADPVCHGYRATIMVQTRHNVLNPESKAILEAIRSLGHTDVTRLTSARQFVLTIQAPGWSQAESLAFLLADQVLSNPVIESSAVYLDPMAAGHPEQVIPRRISLPEHQPVVPA